MTKLLLIVMMVGLWSGCGEDIKVWKEEYSKDKVKEEYQYYNHPDNNRRIKDGWYNSFYKNGEYWEVGTYKDNEKHGEWTSFSEDGKETKGIWKDGKKDSGEFWINVKKDSSWTTWVETEDEVVETTWFLFDVYRGLFTYDDGLWNGLVVLYWMNGHKRSEGLYEDGKNEGYYKRFYEEGGIEWEGNFVVGKMDGKWVFYTENGEMEDEDIWKDGECVEMCEGNDSKPFTHHKHQGETPSRLGKTFIGQKSGSDSGTRLSII